MSMTDQAPRRGSAAVLPAHHDELPASVTTTPKLNFVVVGQQRSGMTAVADLLNNHGHAICHVGLFAADAQTRRQAHEAYFGPCSIKKPVWFCQGDKDIEGGKFSHPCEYLDEVFASAQHGEQAIGVCIPYDVIARHELYEHLTELTYRGDFCLVHVVRNPAICLVSQVQAEQSGRYIAYAGERSLHYAPLAVSIDPSRMAEFINRHCAVRNKIASAADDAVELNYADFISRFDKVAGRLFQFLELPDRSPVCRTQRLVPMPLRRRLLNFDHVVGAVPHAMQHWFDGSEPF